MSMDGDAAELLARQCLQMSETCLKLGGSALKELALFFAALAKNPQKLKGKTRMTNFIKNYQGVPKIYYIKREDLKRFSKMADKHGILWAATGRKGNPDGTVDVLTRDRDVVAMNRIMELLGYPIPRQEQEDTQKKTGPEVQPGTDSPWPRNGSITSPPRSPGTEKSSDRTEEGQGEKASVRGRLAHYMEDIQAAQGQAKTPQGPEVPIKRGRIVKER